MEQQAITLVHEALLKHSDFAKLWMMLGQIQEQQGLFDEARETYTKAVGF